MRRDYFIPSLRCLARADSKTIGSVPQLELRHNWNELKGRQVKATDESTYDVV